MQNKTNKTRLLIFGFLAAVVASMALVANNGEIKAALAQGTNETSSSGMNMTGTQGGGVTNQTTVTRDTVT